MNIMIKDDNYTPESSQRIDFRIEPLLQKLAIKALRSAQNVLDETLIQSIQKSYSEQADEGNNIVGFLEFFLFSLINRIDKLQQIASINIVREDYETLESAVQKSEAEIRKHIRIQQQLKIYLDSLEEKVEELEGKLLNEENKYTQLFETLRELQQERRQMQKKLLRLQEGRQKSKPSSNFSTINDVAYKQYLVGRRKGSKSRNIEKMGERPRKMSDKRDNSKHTHFVDGAIQINLSNNIVVSKKNSYDQNIKHNHVSNDSSIRELTKTVQMKQPVVSSTYEKQRPSRKISKYRTQAGEQGKKEFRSSSVCY